MLSRTQRGFTLIEVMVVVVIVGVISAVVLLSTGLLEDDREMQEESRRMTTLLELAADEALLQGRDFGLEITQSGYRFVEYDPYLEQWFEITDDAILR
ncbi:MAG: type II secretion system minor pseudopilin GspH, partial [Woeseia sp.]|nr:type II secretion system minor pseudopilin GspH [Woeseia sp.]